ncbi:MAG: SoxR reducing system RseC family protein [Mariprofundaceae bacterium]|nr:SoxR reducing system RseC family protein [Mariprofundaceae bacterium]
MTELIAEDAIVSGERQSSCSSCAGKTSCSTLGSWQSRPVTMRVDNRLQAQVGDCVDIEVADHLILQASFRLYGLPMIAFLLAGFSAWQFSSVLNLAHIDLYAALAALLGVVLTYRWIWRQDHQQQACVAKIVAIR